MLEARRTAERVDFAGSRKELRARLGDSVWGSTWEFRDWGGEFGREFGDDRCWLCLRLLAMTGVLLGP